MSFDLNKRHQQILWATIRQYIATAEPVGSKTLVDGYNLNVSPATIRSGFASLEKAGFLYHQQGEYPQILVIVFMSID